jgi:hypothetical protein
LVLRLAWLTLFPESTAFPVNSQRRAIASILLHNLAEAGAGRGIKEMPNAATAWRDIRGRKRQVKAACNPPLNLRIDEIHE